MQGRGPEDPTCPSSPTGELCSFTAGVWPCAAIRTVCSHQNRLLSCRNTNLLIRGGLLFSVGVFLALVLNLLQVQRNVTLFPPDVISSIFSSAWWVPPCCGTASGVYGRVRGVCGGGGYCSS